MKLILIWALIGILGGMALLPGQGVAADGRSLYYAKCAMCHGVNGKCRDGTLTPKSSDDELKIAAAIKKHGKGKGKKKMPAFNLKSVEIKAIIDYMRTFEK